MVLNAQEWMGAFREAGLGWPASVEPVLLGPEHLVSPDVVMWCV